MRLELTPSTKHLRYFCEVARQASFTRAAELLQISQPTVSAGVDSLERQVGLPLFEIVNRRVLLTDAGKLLFQHVERSLLELSDAERAIAGLKRGEAGRLVVGGSSTPGTYVLPLLLGQLQQSAPGIEVELQIGSTSEILARVQRGELNLALVGEAAFDPALTIEQYGVDRLPLVAAPAHPLAHAGKVALEALEHERVIVREPGSSTRDTVLKRLHALGIRPGSIMELGSPEAVKRSVAAGLGVAFMSEYSIQGELRLGDLVRVPTAGEGLQRGLYLISRPTLQRDPLQDRFCRMVREYLGCT